MSFEILSCILNSNFVYIRTSNFFWNHPFNNVDFDVEDNLLKSVFDVRFEGLRSFFRNAGTYLTDDGTLILGSGELANQGSVETIATTHGWKRISTEEYVSPSRIGGSTPMKLYIHEYKRE